MGPERKKETLDEFFRTQLRERQRREIEAICVDMWKPYGLSLEQWAPQGRIIYDLNPAHSASRRRARAA